MLLVAGHDYSPGRTQSRAIHTRSNSFQGQRTFPWHRNPALAHQVPIQPDEERAVDSPEVQQDASAAVLAPRTLAPGFPTASIGRTLRPPPRARYLEPQAIAPRRVDGRHLGGALRKRELEVGVDGCVVPLASKTQRGRLASVSRIEKRVHLGQDGISCCPMTHQERRAKIHAKSTRGVRARRLTYRPCGTPSRSVSVSGERRVPKARDVKRGRQ